ncbi:GNAT family N-acetyltransferase [Nocardioides cynanchi]|uniref:GNAT family N-acetyltransferase n=1 Tax=Nocardioides cynanchi TaxID=2558918 RepID=UPI0012444550|nr:GNAT family N-acetyltransferase [Nocardioides cynanchi]
MLEIHDVDLDDETQLQRWYDAWAAAQAARPAGMIESWQNARVVMPRRHPDFHVDLFSVVDGGEVVGAGLVNLPLHDNLTVAYAEISTRPEHRRRGVGAAVLAEVERRAAAAGRERVLTEVFTPPGGTSPGVGFAEGHGYTVASREGMKALEVGASEPRWAALEDQVTAVIGDYRILLWRDVVPDEHVDQMCVLLGQFMSLVPQGELDLEDGEWTVERYRAAEQRRVEVGAAVFLAVAVAPDGSLVAANELRLNTHDPRVAQISITMVLPGHRGHRLGLATKLATHRALRAAFPECGLVVTSNSDENDHMNAINDALGYRVLENLLEYHRRL